MEKSARRYFPNNVDDGGALFVVLGDEVVEVLVLRGSQGLQSEVIDDEQRHAGKGVEASLVGVDGACGIEARQQLALGGEQHVVVGAHGGVAERLCDVGLSGAARSGDEDRDFLGDEAAGDELEEVGIGDLVGDGLAVARLERVEDPGQTQSFEQRCELGQVSLPRLESHKMTA